MIAVRNLEKRYGDTRAVDDVTFEVAGREVLGFLGPNGAGKTTTMRILTGYIPPSGGAVTVAGYDVRRQPLEVRRRIGYLPESAPLYEDMGVLDYLRYVAEMRGYRGGERRRRVARVVEQCGLEEALAKKVGQLSKGYRQRVGLAQAMVHEPEILILDEPTSGLDPNQIIEIRSLIRDLGREKTVILSTHILPEVSATCGRVIIIAHGRLVGSGTPEDLVRSASSGAGVAVALRGSGEVMEARLRALEGVGDVTFTGIREDVLAYRLAPADGVNLGILSERVAGLAVREGWGLRELRPESASLEDVFRDLTTGE